MCMIAVCRYVISIVLAQIENALSGLSRENVTCITLSSYIDYDSALGGRDCESP